MTEKETKEGNKLIAEFISPDCFTVEHKDYSEYCLKTKSGMIKRNEYKFHESWDWLMPVIEKIEQVTGKDTEITFWKGTQRCIILDYDNLNDLEKMGETKIEATYKCVIEFIKWYDKK